MNRGIGSIVMDQGIQFEVVWSGGPLLPARASHPAEIEEEWEPPSRLYSRRTPAGGVLVKTPPLDQHPISYLRSKDYFKMKMEALRGDTHRDAPSTEDGRGKGDPKGKGGDDTSNN